MGLRNMIRKAVVAVLGNAPANLVLTPGQAVWALNDYESYIREGYAGNPYVHRAVKLYSESASGIPTHAYTIKNGERVLAPENHPVSKLVQRANPMDPFFSLVESAAGSYLLSSVVYAIAVATADGRPRELYWVRPDKVNPISGPTLGSVAGYEISTREGKRVYPPESVFCLRGWDALQNKNPASSIKAAERSIDTNNSARIHNKAVFDNGGFPGVIVNTGEQYNAAREKEYTKSWKKRHSGPTQSGRALFGWGKWKIEKFGLSPEELQVDKSLIRTAIEICVAAGIPPELVGIQGQKTYSNYKEARKALYVEGVIPFLVRFYQALTIWLNKFYPEIVVGFDRNEIEALQEDRDALWKRVAECEVLSIDQKRALLGYDPIGPAKGGDTILVPAGKMPLEDILLQAKLP